MNQNLETFKTAFETFQQAFESFEENLKDELSNVISEMVKEGRLDETQIAIDCLKEVMNEIQFTYDISKTEQSLNKFSAKLNTIKCGEKKSSPFTPEQLQNIKKNISEEQTMDPEFSEIENLETLETISNKLASRQYTLVSRVGNRLNVMKKNKNLQLVYIENKQFSEKEFINLLEEMNQLKNIGFIFEDAMAMHKSKITLEEWVKTKPEYETRFLSVNFINLEMLNKANEFEVVRY